MNRSPREILRPVAAAASAVVIFLLRLVLAVAYFVLFSPLLLFFKKRPDFLGTKNRRPSWIARKPIDDMPSFLSRQ